MARIFVSYSHRDERWKDRVVKQLAVLATEGLEVWDDRRIAAGADWEPEIAQAIAGCDVALLLISADFLTSRFILGQEVPPLLQRRQEAGIRVIPLILSPCAWTRIPWLRPIQARPKDGKPLSGLSKHDAEAALASLADEIAGLNERLGPKRVPGQPVPPERIDLSHLPAGAEHFLGRQPELAALETAWTQPGTALVELIAPGGTGKTALVKRWLDGLRAKGWSGVAQVYGWSFYSQGTGEDRQASEDHFLAAAIEWFSVDIAPSANPADKGQALAERIRASRTLLVLDGLEPLQYRPGPLAGELRAPGLQALLTRLASAGHPGLCLLTSREWVQDLAEWVCNDTNSDRPVLRLDLGNLSDTDGARLLHTLGVKCAGAAAIGPDDAELMEASRAVHGHALTLSLLGNYLRLAHDGDIRRRDRVDFADANQAGGGHAFRVMAAYERWLASGGDDGARCLAVLRLLGFFDRPATAEALKTLRAAPPIPGLTEPLFALPKGGPDPSGPSAEPITDTQWRITVAHLVEAGLIERPGEDGTLDAHPLMREHLADRLKTRHPEAWREGHRRLYEWLKASVPHRPEGLAGLQPLYQAVTHGCQAGLYQEACDEVYIDRILRGTGDDGFYSWKKLGAFGANLGALACFFADPWNRPTETLKVQDQAWLLHETAIQLRALGRLPEALEPMRIGAESRVKHEDWTNAAISYNNLSELQLTLGQTLDAVVSARRSGECADLSGNTFQRMSVRTSLADALYQQGKTEEALAAFAEAEHFQAEDQPAHPILYSLAGFRFCSLLLASAERAAWVGVGTERTVADADCIAACDEVAQLGRRALKIATHNRLSPINLALDHLTVARCAFYAGILQGHPPSPETQRHAERALHHLRASQYRYMLPLGLLTRAWLRHCVGEAEAARADLDEAQRIATRGGMALHLADIALTRARLFHDRAALAKARELIEEHGYGRRLPELQDAEAAAESWPA
jgi:hypothetical protein